MERHAWQRLSKRATAIRDSRPSIRLPEPKNAEIAQIKAPPGILTMEVLYQLSYPGEMALSSRLQRRWASSERCSGADLRGQSENP
jgi:hypothetical protein